MRDPRPIVVEISLHLKNKNVRDPGPQAFGFLINSRAVVPLGHLLDSRPISVDHGKDVRSRFPSTHRENNWWDNPP